MTLPSKPTSRTLRSSRPTSRRSKAWFIAVAVAMAACLTACSGPTKAGKEARAAANDRMNILSAQIHYDQARQSFECGQFDKASQQITRALHRYFDSPAYHLLQGRISLETHQLEAALDSFRTAISLCEKADEKLQMGKDVDQNKRTVPGASTSLASVASSPSSPLQSTLAQAHYFTGILYQRWSDDARAYESYNAAYELETTNAQYLLAAAESLIALGDFEGAKDLITPRLAYFEHNAALRQLQAHIALLQGDPKLAVELYTQARLLNPDEPMLLEQLLWAQYAAGMYGPCLESIRRLQDRPESRVQTTHSATHPASPSAYGASLSRLPALSSKSALLHMRARCLTMMGRAVEARDAYLELSRLCPDDASVWSELAALSWDMGEVSRVSMCGRKLTAIAPDRYEGYMFRAIDESQRGNLPEAITLLRQSIASAGGSESVLVHLLLGRSLEQSGDRAAAKSNYQRALAIEPGNAEATELLRRLTEEPGQLSAAVDSK